TPAAPPLPMAAMLPFTHVELAAPFDQFASVVVFQFPLPSTGAAGFAPLESQVSVWPEQGIAHSAPTSGALARTILLDFRVQITLRMFIPPRENRRAATDFPPTIQ